MSEKMPTAEVFQQVEQNKVALDIIRQIRQTILDGKLRPGDRLPPEKELVLKFGVSKHSLREALRALETMGFLSIRKGAGGGAVVLEVDLKTTRDSIFNFLHFQNVSVADLSEVRRIFEPHLAKLAAERMSEEDLERLRFIHERCKEDFSRGENIYRHEIEFHRVLAEAGGNPVLVLIQDFVNNQLEEHKLNLRPGLGFMRQVLDAHDRILAAVQAGDGDAAGDEMLRHVRQVEDTLEDIRSGKEEAERAEF